MSNMPTSRQSLTPLDEALAILQEQAWTLGVEQVPLAACLRRVLQEPCVADMDMPPFNKAAMDGYACRRVDLEQPLQVLECIQAGGQPDKCVSAGHCSKIMTGAMLPEGADCVSPVEYVENVGQHMVQIRDYAGGDNICAQGEDIRAGETLIAPGVSLSAQHIGVLAAMGYARPTVACRPRIGILSTGNEIAPPEAKPAPGCIRNSNAAQLLALLQKLGFEAQYYGIISDEPEALRRSIETALSEQDVLLSTGGVSVGDFDFIPEIIHDLGLRIHFRRLAIQPGKPVVFATGDAKAIVALSGNPVSSFLQCLLLVKPFLACLQGDNKPFHYSQAPLETPFRRKRAERAMWIPVAFSESGTLVPCPFHGSAHLAGLLGAAAFAEIPMKRHTVEAGEILRVCPF